LQRLSIRDCKKHPEICPPAEPDTQVKNGSIEQLVLFMEGCSDAGSGRNFDADGSKQNSIANFPSLATELSNKKPPEVVMPEKFLGKERDYSEPVEVDSVIGACMMVRREAVDQIGFMDEDYFFSRRDRLVLSNEEAGWKVYHVPQAKVYHFQGKSAEKEKERAKVEYFRSRYYFFKKNRDISNGSFSLSDC